MIWLFIYLVLVNVLAAILAVADKIKAIRGKSRISERTLITTAAIGGAAGMYLTMCLIRHKTLHKRFMIGLPLIILSHMSILIFVFIKFFS